MATKPENIVTFYGPGYGEVQLVKKSISYRFYTGRFWDGLQRCYVDREFWYWRGQLIHRWSGKGPNEGEEWGTFYKGQIIWLDAGIFHKKFALC